MALVVDQLEIIVLKAENILNHWINTYLREGVGFARELSVRLLQVVHIEVRIAHGVDESRDRRSASLKHQALG